MATFPDKWFKWLILTSNYRNFVGTKDTYAIDMLYLLANKFLHTYTIKTKLLLFTACAGNKQRGRNYQEIIGVHLVIMNTCLKVTPRYQAFSS